MTASAPEMVFVVRSEGCWWLTPVPAADPVEVTLADVRAVVAGCGASSYRLRSGPVGRGRVGVVFGAGDVVAPVRTLVGVVTADGLVIEDVDGAHVVLDDVDVVVLDALSGPVRVGELAGVCGLDVGVVCERVAGLFAAGRLRRVDRGDVEFGDVADGSEVVVVPSAASVESVVVSGRVTLGDRWRDGVRRSSKVAWLRRRLGLAPLVVPVGDSGGVVESVVPVGSVGGVGVDVTDVVWAGTGDGVGRIPVYAIWHPHVGPLLSLGMLTAAARHWNGGALVDRFEIRRPETADEFLEDLRGRPAGPAVLLCSDYVWSLNENLDAARAGLAVNPELFVIHGGPSCPKYEGDAEVFLDTHGEVAHVLTRGEGEQLLCELLDALCPSGERPLRLVVDAGVLSGIAGVTFRGGDGVTVRTPDRERIADLDALPSPYLTGEFDHIPAAAWNYCMSVETNRGCPYGCTFCDWGSSTLSRIRKFDLERVTAEIMWAARRGVTALNIPDANFGIMSRDVETAERLAEIKRETGSPQVLVFYPAKNTTKHLSKIMDIIGEVGISSAASLSLQSTDPTTLDALDRNNISTDHFVALAADYRRRGHPLQGDLLLGLPGQTYDSYRNDLQFMLDHEILVRTWPTQILPNAPMNDPEYRSEWGIVSDERNLIMSADSFSTDDRTRMIRLRRIDLTLERYGVLRHVMRWLQWDHGVAATTLMDHLLTTIDTTPDRYPHLTWLLEYFDLHPTVPVGWSSLYAEVRDLLVTDFGIAPDDDGLETVLALQQFLMPQPGREFPASITLAHDYVAYYRNATHSLYTTGHAGTPDAPLVDQPPATFTVTGDPLGLCDAGIRFAGDSRDEVMQGDFYIASNTSFEMTSALTRLLPQARRSLERDDLAELLPLVVGHPPAMADAGHSEHDDDPDRDGPFAAPVSLRPGRRVS